MTAGGLTTGAFAAAAAWFVVRPPVAHRLAVVLPGSSIPSRDVRPVNFRLTGCGVLAFAVLWAAAGTAVTALAAIAVTVGVVAARRSRLRRREEQLRSLVGEVCRSIAAELRSGATAGAAFRGAVEAAPPLLRARLRPAADAAAAGDAAQLADAMVLAAEAAPGLTGLRVLAGCWRVAVASGAMAAPVVDRVADALHDELDLDRALAAALAGPRATWRLLAALPVAGVLLGVAVGADPLRFLVGSPAGLACLAGGALLDAAGLAWARRIARRPGIG